MTNMPRSGQVALASVLALFFGASVLASSGIVEVRAQGMTLDICPTDYGSFPENAPTLTCGCSAEAVKAGNVRGTNPYYYQSSPCRAAVHAGAIGPEGGHIVIQPEKAPFFPAVTRNGVAADSWGQGKGFRIVVAAQPATPKPPAAGAANPAAPAQATGMTLDICPTDYGSFPEDAPPLTCGCTGAAVKAGNVRGANPYYYQSSLCRAALHAGAIGAQGGQIVVQPAKAPFFPAVLRNGVEAELLGRRQGLSDSGRSATGDAAAACHRRRRDGRSGAIRRHDARHLSVELWQLPGGRPDAHLRL